MPASLYRIVFRIAAAVLAVVLFGVALAGSRAIERTSERRASFWSVRQAESWQSSGASPFT